MVGGPKDLLLSPEEKNQLSMSFHFLKKGRHWRELLVSMVEMKNTRKNNIYNLFSI